MNQVQQYQQPDFGVIEQVMISGDLSGLQPQQRTEFYKRVCESVGLNPLTQPFAYIKLNGRLALYAKKDATDQLSKLHGVSVRIVDKQWVNDVYLVDVEATDKNGRVTADMGAVPVAGLQGERLANAMMKAITKAKRRATLSICGLGWLDETETDTIPNAPTFTVEESHQLPEQSTAATAGQFHAVTGHQPNGNATPEPAAPEPTADVEETSDDAPEVVPVDRDRFRQLAGIPDMDDANLDTLYEYISKYAMFNSAANNRHELCRKCADWGLSNDVFNHYNHAKNAYNQVEERIAGLEPTFYEISLAWTVEVLNRKKAKKAEKEQS